MLRVYFCIATVLPLLWLPLPFLFLSDFWSCRFCVWPICTDLLALPTVHWLGLFRGSRVSLQTENRNRARGLKIKSRHTQRDWAVLSCSGWHMSVVFCISGPFFVWSFFAAKLIWVANAFFVATNGRMSDISDLFLSLQRPFVGNNWLIDWTFW